MSIYKRGKIWWIHICAGGRQLRQSARTTDRATAQRVEADKRSELLSIAPLPGGLEDILSEYLVGDATCLRDYNGLLSRARAIRPYLIGKPISAAPDIANEIKRGMQHLSRATINRRLALLRRLCNLAYDWGRTNQQIGRRIKLLPGETQRHYYLTRQQVERLASAAGGSAGDAIRMAAYTGMRQGELLALQPSYIDDGVIVLPAHMTKTHRPRTIPIHPAASRIALPLDITYPYLRRRFEAARKATGMPHVRFHDLRHTYASWLIQAGIDLRTVQELLGHAAAQTTQRYTHLADKHLIAAVNKISA